MGGSKRAMRKRRRFGLEGGICQHRIAEIASREGVFLIRGIAAGTQRRQADGAIEQAGIQMWQTEMSCEGTGNRPFA